jgi:hypothetical protein
MQSIYYEILNIFIMPMWSSCRICFGFLGRRVEDLPAADFGGSVSAEL